MHSNSDYCQKYIVFSCSMPGPKADETQKQHGVQQRHGTCGKYYIISQRLTINQRSVNERYACLKVMMERSLQSQRQVIT